MPYIKQTWIDNESPLTADRMNHIEDGIESTDASVTSLDSRISNLAGGGQPIVVTSADQMEDNAKIYLYMGDETGYEAGHWYYYTTEWTDGGQYGADGGVNTNARNLLKYILERVAYTEQGMQVYVNALYEALAQTGGGGGTTSYMIINALTNVTNSNDATGCDEGDSYTATLTPDTDYTIDTVTVTMGGVDVTSTVYSNGTITISSVSGDVVITANAVAVKYSWALTDEDFAISHGSCSVQSSTYDVYVSTITQNYNNRRYAHIANGVKPFYLTSDGSTYSVTDPPEYPIPVPDDATSITYSITPNTQFMGVNLIEYDEDTGLYTTVHAEGWKQGTYTFNFTAKENQYITMVTKYNSAGSSYPTEPTEITVEFSK